MSKAVLFDAECPGQRFAGLLTVDSRAVVFRDADGKVRELSTGRLQCRTGGIDNRTVYFSHPDHPGVEVVSEDFDLLLGGPLSELPAIKAAVASSRGYQRRFWGGIGIGGCLVLLALLLGGGLLFWIVRFLVGLF